MPASVWQVSFTLLSRGGGIDIKTFFHRMTEHLRLRTK